MVRSFDFPLQLIFWQNCWNRQLKWVIFWRHYILACLSVCFNVITLLFTENSYVYYSKRQRGGEFKWRKIIQNTSWHHYVFLYVKGKVTWLELFAYETRLHLAAEIFLIKPIYLQCIMTVLHIKEHIINLPYFLFTRKILIASY